MRQIITRITAYAGQLRKNRSSLTLILSGLVLLTLYYFASEPSRSGPPPAAPLVSSKLNHWPGWSNVNHMIVFGDSYTTTGFNIDRTQPSAKNPLGNPPYPGHTSSNGPNWLGFLTTTYNQSLIKTLNFAMGGATVDGDLIRQYLPTITSFKNQVHDLYLPHYAKPTSDFNWIADDTLFAVFFGINDINNSYRDGSSSWVLEQDIAQYADLLDTIYQTGARNILLMHVPPVDRSPLVLKEGETSIKDKVGYVSAFNANISRIAANLSSTYADARTFIFDTHTLYGQVLDDPCSHAESCALKDTTAFCSEYSRSMRDWYASDPKCSFPVDQYFWLNSGHPTFRIHNVTAKVVAAQLSEETSWDSN